MCLEYIILTLDHSALRWHFQVSLVTKLRLLKHFKGDELPEELGGSMTLNHEQWIKSRIVSDCHFNSIFTPNKMATTTHMKPNYMRIKQ